MASRRKKNAATVETEPAPPDALDSAGPDTPVEPGTIADPEAYKEALASGRIKEIDPESPEGLERNIGRPEPQKLPDRAIQLTAKRCFLARTVDPVVTAFLAVEARRPSGVRKMTREQWDAELKSFIQAPR